MHLYKEYFKEYAEAGFSVIPDKYAQKRPAISGWSDYCDRLPTEKETSKWVSTFESTNIALCLGQASGIVALDFDCEDPQIIEIVEQYLPTSPVEKVGAKGWTRFFRYTDETSNSLKWNGKTVIEILAEGRKTTLPPSKHPTGMSYKWGELTLLDIKKEQLPVLPGNLLYCLEQELKMRFPDSIAQGRKIVSGRNDALSKYCSTLIAKSTPVDDALNLLIQYDEENHKPPLFSDIDEMHHTEKFSNALAFYSNHLNSFNKKSFKNNKEYETPITAHTVDHEVAKEVRSKKSQSGEVLKESSLELPKAQGVLAAIQYVINKNAHRPQPVFAMSASLALVAILAGRKFVFEGNAPNLFILNVAESGTGKDAPQRIAKEILAALKLDDLVGAGDYVSDAALMDGLEATPERLDFIDEAAGFFEVASKGGATYNSKIGDVLAALATVGTSIFPGRATREGTKGKCVRPQVNIVASTTLAGLRQGITPAAIDKGLMGRFLIFAGDPFVRGRRRKKGDIVELSTECLSKLEYIRSYNAPLSGKYLNGFEQKYLDMDCTEEADKRLDEIFESIEDTREKIMRSNKKEKTQPMLNRLYQLICKIAMIHSISRMGFGTPIVDIEDVEYGYGVINYYYGNMKKVIEKNIFSNKTEKNKIDVLEAILKAGEKGITKTILGENTGGLTGAQRNSILEDLKEEGKIFVERRKIDGSRSKSLVYIGVEHVKTWNQ